MKRKNLFKRIIAGCLICATAFVVCACGGNKQVVINEDPNKVPPEPYEINWDIPSTAAKDVSWV